MFDRQEYGVYSRDPQEVDVDRVRPEEQGV